MFISKELRDALMDFTNPSLQLNHHQLNTLIDRANLNTSHLSKLDCFRLGCAFQNLYSHEVETSSYGANILGEVDKTMKEIIEILTYI